MRILSTLHVWKAGATRVLQALKDDKGQDLVEYAAVIVLVVLALTGGMTTLASAINNAMTNVGTLINATIG